MEAKLFSQAVKRFVDKYSDSVESSVKRLGFELLRRTIIRTTRVCTGRMRNGWHVSFHAPSNWVPSSERESKPDPGFDMNVKELYVQNNVYYAVYHEFGCLSSGETRILTTKGLVPIKKIKEGDLVYTHENRFRPVVQKHVYDLEGLDKKIGFVSITVNNKKKLTVTDNHKIMTDFGWVEAGKLQVGDQVFMVGNSPLVRKHKNFFCLDCHRKEGRHKGEIIHIRKWKQRNFSVPGITKLYDLSVQEDKSYVANGVVVHNTSRGLKPLLMLTRSVQELRGEMEKYVLEGMEPLWNKEINGITGAGLAGAALKRKQNFLKSFPRTAPRGSCRSMKGLKKR
jgi:hypothetical protein